MRKLQLFSRVPGLKPLHYPSLFKIIWL